MFLSVSLGGRIGIRTPGCSHINGFQDRRFRPLSHPSIYFVDNKSSILTFTGVVKKKFSFIGEGNIFATSLVNNFKKIIKAIEKRWLFEYTISSWRNAYGILDIQRFYGYGFLQ